MEKRDGWFYIKIIGVSEVENPTNKTEIIERHQFKKKKHNDFFKYIKNCICRLKERAVLQRRLM